MPRTKRILYDGAIYHIINRGHNEQILFKENRDFGKFKKIIAEYIKRYNFKLYNYCLMINHFHFLMRTEKADHLPCIMKGICQSYANYYKKKYGTIGYLFQNRYKSILIKRDEYLSECARYIERNPVRANITKDPSEYPWSSYNYYAKGKKDDIITPNILYQDFGNTQYERMQNYINYVAESRPYELLLDTVIANMK